MESTADEPKAIRKRQRKTLVCAECRSWLIISSSNVNDQMVGLVSLVSRGAFKLSVQTKQPPLIIVASTREVHKRNEQLSDRIQQLEAALAELQAASSMEPHPLLSQDLLQVKSLPGAVGSRVDDANEEDIAVNEQELSILKEEEDDLVDAFGTLHLTADGGYFYGGSAACEFLVTDTEGSWENRAQEGVPTNLLLLASQFPFYSLNNAIDDLKNQLRSNLPSLQDAWRVITIYFDNAAWLYRPFSKDTFLEEVVTPIYQDQGTIPVSGSQLALMYIVLGIGTLADTQTPKYHVLAEHYHQLARASLALQNVFANPSLTALQAVFGLCLYATLSDQRDMIQESSILQGALVKMAQGIGLHRDPAKFNLPQREIHRRRRVFWEIYFFDMWLSFAVGRPAGISLMDVDTELPVYPEDKIDSKGFHRIKIEFALRFLRPALEKLFSSGKRKYSTILDLDKEINNEYIYPEQFKISGLDPDVPIGSEQVSSATIMQRHALRMIKEILLVYIHRGCFAQAIQQSRSDPLASKFAPSVAATHRSACALLSCLRHSFEVEREATLRVPFFWSHAGTCSVILAATAIMATKTPFAMSSLAELDQACNLFGEASSNRRVARYLPTILNLRDKARSMLLQINTGRLLEPSTQQQESLQELSGLSGATRIACEIYPSTYYMRPHDPQNCQQVDINLLEAPPYGRLDISTVQTNHDNAFLGSLSLETPYTGGIQSEGSPVEFDEQAIQRMKNSHPILGPFIAPDLPATDLTVRRGNTGEPFTPQRPAADSGIPDTSNEVAAVDDQINLWASHIATVQDGPEMDWGWLMNELGIVE
ncbi:hypothetical protein FRC14_001440 [Serendipita sp. 396]|nr:hypothetical protein FRC14_001440 [Serendipita sp. 396]